MSFWKYISFNCAFFTWANIFKSNRRMEKKKEKNKNRKERILTFRIELGSNDFESAAHESRIYTYIDQVAQHSSQILLARKSGHSWTLSETPSSVFRVNHTEYNSNLADVSLNKLKHIKHRTFIDSHCEKRCTTLVLSTPTKTRDIRKARSVFRINITGHNVYATPRIGFRLASLDRNY